MAGKGGGAWKVAYADFVTAMMAFFLVMWIVAQSKPVKEAIAGYFRDPSGYASRPGKPSAIKSKKDASGTSPLDKGPFNAARSRPPSLPGGEPADTIEERTAARTNRITLGNDDNINVGTQVLFADDSAVLDDRGKRVLDQLTPELLGKICKIEIRGHASGRRLPADSTFSDAWQLSYARSVAAMEYLLAKGVDPRRIRLSQGGIHEPNLLVDGVGRNAQNARVEVYVLNEVVSAPSETEKRRNTPKKFAPKLPARPKAGETHE